MTTPAFANALQFAPIYAAHNGSFSDEVTHFDLMEVSGAIPADEVGASSAGQSRRFRAQGRSVTLNFHSKQPMPRSARLTLDLTCDDGVKSLPVNVFWIEGGSARFHRDRSTKSVILDGHAQWENLGSVLERSRPDVRALRLILRNEDRCSTFAIAGLHFQLQSTTP